MGLRVTTNVAALNTHRVLARTDQATTASLRRLSSGLRITSAADDAAGLAISEGLRAQVRGMTVAVRNTQDGIGVVRTADGALGEVSAVLQRMRDLSVQAAGTGVVDARATEAVGTEIEQLKRELDRIAHTTAFNGIPLLDGSYDRLFQVGANVAETVRVVIPPTGRGLDTAGLGLAAVGVGSGGSVPATVVPAVSAAEGTPSPGRLSLAGDYVSAGTVAASYRALTGTVSYGGRSFDLASVDYTGAVTAQDHIDRLDSAALAALQTTFIPFVATATELVFTGQTPGPGSTAADAAAMTPTYSGRSGSADAIRLLDEAIGLVSSARAYLGAVENRFAHTVDRLTTSIENTAASESRIRDADVAAETVVLTRSQILGQAGTAMLAQATRAPELVLTLLR
ncbi:flagellin [Geodermatophilus bullaregiensis]|uniref:flagellin N-terminal helical domain-containing protein n=1 Tax=Geodermatophilus bullaregiensis TaxID=1564160 RepID=UPI001EF81C51|nr:flagellin [Geodermatophilus bullaregiensis]MBM7807668.1 flagellin [Geodermatophilus bullaregiensis]